MYADAGDYDEKDFLNVCWENSGHEFAVRQMPGLNCKFLYKNPHNGYHKS